MCNDLSSEHCLLHNRPGLCDKVVADPEFIQWRNSLPTVDVDGEEFRVIWGDRLVDNCQLVVEWVNRFRPELLEGWDGKSEPKDIT
jgi:hypothetical protein